MHSLITSYLLQNKECTLPGIGVLQIIHTSASTDAANNRILSPFEEIIFNKEDHLKSPDLVKYIADKKHIETSEAADLLNNFCKDWKVKLKTGKKLYFETVGSIYKNADGIITFERVGGFTVLQPIAVNTIYKKSEEPVLPVEEQTVLTEKKIIKEDVVVERSYWRLWALILLTIGSVLLIYNFKDHKLPGSSTGNQTHLVIDSAKATYHK